MMFKRLRCVPHSWRPALAMQAVLSECLLVNIHILVNIYSTQN